MVTFLSRLPEARIYVAGHNGLVGSAIVRKLRETGARNLLLRSSAELDLRNQAATLEFFEQEQPEYVFLAAARVGGILANSQFPAQFLYDNIMIASNVIHASHLSKVRKLLNLGSSCIYPKLADQPLREDYLLTGPLEETNRAYAIAKIAAIELCDSYRTQYGSDFISAMPTNLYGPHDNFDLQTSHVLPALIRKVHTAKVQGDSVVTVWGTGRPLREFLYSEDLADACLYLMEHVSEDGPINVGTGTDVSIHDLAFLIARVVGYDGEFVFDSTKPDGTPRKLMDVSRLRTLGWQAPTDLEEGIRKTYDWYVQNEVLATGSA